MKKYFEKTKKIKFKPLEREFEFVYTNNIRKALDKRYKKLKVNGKSISNTTDGLWCEHNSYAVLIIDDRASTGVIAHEAYHAVCGLFKSVGTVYNDEEMTAYHLGYIVDQITKFIKKCK